MLESCNKSISKPIFLAKYIPPTPPQSRGTSNKDFQQSVLRSQCPSPTPLFQQLYIAVSHWERVLADTPDLLKEKDKLIRDLENLPQATASRSRSRDEGEDTDDECSAEASPKRHCLNVFSPSLNGSSRRNLLIGDVQLTMRTSSSGDTKFESNR